MGAGHLPCSVPGWVISGGMEGQWDGGASLRVRRW